MELSYRMIVVQDEDMNGKVCYRAEHPELPGCMSHGNTPIEAVQNLVDARRLYIQTRLDLGLAIPEPAIPTVGTSVSQTQLILQTTVNLLASEVPVTPITEKDYETDLPASYDMIAERAA